MDNAPHLDHAVIAAKLEKKLDGGGGLRAPGRWHTRGRRIVYCAPNPATALLEVLVHASIDLEDMPVNFRYLEIEVADTVSMDTVPVGAVGRKWGRKWHTELETTRRFGDEWLHSGRTALLRVPSVIAPATWNMLITPSIRIADRSESFHSRDHPIDLRLLR
ncbi:MAG TPA: RES family NAD+ phosphorylase [Candidatus Acidoferrales bacterium]|nr:RES family NAD+ phosphorylase [Candidatus Acidoferrales bacterium]